MITHPHWLSRAKRGEYRKNRSQAMVSSTLRILSTNMFSIPRPHPVPGLIRGDSVDTEVTGTDTSHPITPGGYGPGVPMWIIRFKVKGCSHRGTEALRLQISMHRKGSSICGYTSLLL